MYTEVVVSTLAIFAISFILSSTISLAYSRKRSLSLLFWSLGMWLFAACALLEMFFATGVYSQFLIKLYLLLVAILVEMLAMGSVTLFKREVFNYSYAAYSIAVTAFLIYALIVAGTLGDLLKDGVVTGALPTSVTIGSVLITAPGAVILILASLVSFLKNRNPKLISVILGVLVLSAGGAMYIASFPSFLYISEFLGILLIWFGVVDLRNIMPKRELSSKKTLQ